MDTKVFDIINTIKKKKDENIDEILVKIKQEYKINILDKDLIFLINLVINNYELLTETLLQIFINFQKKIDHKIVIKKDDNISSQDSNLVYSNIFLNIFSKFGYIFIIPHQIIVLWNEKIISNKNFSSNFTKSVLDNDESELIIRNINYEIINSNNIKLTEKEKKYDYYMRKIGLKQYKFGFQDHFQLMIPLDVERLFLSVSDTYKGKICIYLNNNIKTFVLKEKNDLQNIIEYYKNDLILLFKQNLFELYKHFYMFIEDTIFMKYIDIIFDTLRFSIKFIKKKNHNYIYITKPKIINDIQIIEPCLHENLLNNIITKDFFNSINNFIQEYVYFSDSMAICKICNEILPSLFIKENLYVDKDKYIVNFNNDILNYDPYNKFYNVKLYFENIFYLFSYYTKLNFSIDSNFIIRLSLDVFIYINSERLMLEQKYKKDIEEDNIFFLRLSNTFFESDNEKEKYKEKKTIFTVYVIFILIICTLTIQDFSEIIYRKKLFTLSNDPTFEEVLCAFIDFLFKKFNYDYYNDDKINIKKTRITRSIEIFYEIFNDEAKYIYQNKKVGLENFFIKKNLLTTILDIPTIESTYYFDHYNDIYDISKQINTNICEYNTDIIYSKNVSYVKLYNYYNKNTKILYIDFNSFNEKTFKNNNLLNTILNEFEEKKQYLYFNDIYNIQHVNDYYILYNDNNILIKYEDDLRNLETLNNSNIFSFFMIYDPYIYKNELLSYEFEEILMNYINFLEKYLNITIITNILLYFNIETIYSRYNLFYYKIQILNICEELLKINNIHINFDIKKYLIVNL